MIWRTRAEHAAEEAAPPPEAEGQALAEALRAQVTLMRAWAKDEQQKREAAEDARAAAHSRAAELENALREIADYDLGPNAQMQPAAVSLKQRAARAWAESAAS